METTFQELTWKTAVLRTNQSQKKNINNHQYIKVRKKNSTQY